MLLKDYIKSNGIRIKDFADSLGTSYNYATQVINGHKRVGVEWAKKIERVTGGKVSRMEALYPEDFVEHSEMGDQMRLSNCPKVDL